MICMNSLPYFCASCSSGNIASYYRATLCIKICNPYFLLLTIYPNYASGNRRINHMGYILLCSSVLYQLPYGLNVYHMLFEKFIG